MLKKYNLLIICAILASCSILAVLITAIVMKPTDFKSNTVPTAPRLQAGFELIDETGQAVSLTTYQDNYKLIYFGFTFCPDICPTQLSVMGKALDILGTDNNAAVTPIFITLDPERDNPQILKTYTDFFHPRLIGLTGSRAQINQAANNFKVYFSKTKVENEGEEYMIDHSSIVFLIGRSNQILHAFTFRDTPETMASSIRKAIQQNP